MTGRTAMSSGAADLAPASLGQPHMARHDMAIDAEQRRAHPLRPHQAAISHTRLALIRATRRTACRTQLQVGLGWDVRSVLEHGFWRTRRLVCTRTRNTPCSSGCRTGRARLPHCEARGRTRRRAARRLPRPPVRGISAFSSSIGSGTAGSARGTATSKSCT